MKKSFTLKGLPHCSGAAIGNFIRSIYMTADERLAIIGVSVDGLGLFERIPKSTVMVSDIVWGLIDKEYSLRSEVFDEYREVGSTDLGTVYSVSIQLNGVSEITTDNFSSVLITSNRRIAEFVNKQDLTITLYVMRVCGTMKESLSSACLQEALKDNSNQVIPLACSGRRAMKCWHNITHNKFTEDLEVFLEGNDSTFDDDYASFDNTVQKYINEILCLLHPELG